MRGLQPVTPAMKNRRRSVPAKPAMIAAAVVALFAASPVSAQPLDGLPSTLRFSAELVPGHYACRDGDRWTNQFDVIDDNAYRMRANPPQDGEFSYDSSNSTIRWASGPFAISAEDTSRVTGYTTIRINDGNPLILMHFEDPAYGASTEYCAMVE